MVAIGSHTGRRVVALVTGMSQPLGTHIGNALEVKEAIDILSCRGGGDLQTVSLLLGSYMLLTSGKAQTQAQAQDMLLEALQSGAGLLKLKELITAQGGDPRVCDDTSLLPQAPFIKTCMSEKEGYVAKTDAALLGLCAMALGAGRREKADVIDPSVGFVLHVRVGDAIHPGDPLFTVHAGNESSLLEAIDTLYRLIPITGTRTAPDKLIDAIVDAHGTTLY